MTETWTPIPQRQHPNLKVRADLSGKHWQEIQALVDRDELFALPDRTSCASCFDGLDEFVEVKFSDHARKSVTYAEGSTPKQLEDLVVKLKALEEKLQNELPPAGTTLGSRRPLPQIRFRTSWSHNDLAGQVEAAFARTQPR